MSHDTDPDPVRDLKEPTITHYGGVSILLHWFAFVAMIVSFITGERLEGPGEERVQAYATHVTWAFFLGIPLLVRVVWRYFDGFKLTAIQQPIYHRLSRLVMISFLFVTAGAVLTGLALPWSAGNDLVIASWALPSPMPENHFLHEALERLHSLFSHLWLPLLLLHVLGALKHAIIDRDGVLKGMLWPQR